MKRNVIYGLGALALALALAATLAIPALHSKAALADPPQGRQYELACPNGYDPIPGWVTQDPATGKARAIACVNVYTGRVFIQPDTAGGAIASLPVSLTSGVTGILPVANGGIGASSFSAAGIATAPITATQTGQNALSFGAHVVTIATPSSDEWLRVSTSIAVTTAESTATGCSTHSSIESEIAWTNAEASATGLSYGTPFDPTTLVPGGATTGQLRGVLVHAKAGTTVRAGYNVATAASGCNVNAVFDTYSEAVP